MANGSGDGSREARPNFDLPEEILSLIPTDPYDQLDLARKITSMAIASRVTKLEMESGELRQRLIEKDRVIEELEIKVTKLESENQECVLRLKVTREENMKLWKERDNLALTVKKLSRDLNKLETFKRQLMQSLNEDNSSTETVEISTYDQSAPEANSVDASNQAEQRYSIMPYGITPRLTPTATPITMSTNASPRKYSAAVSPQKTSGATSPKAHPEGRVGSFSSFFPSSQQSSAASSPPRGGRQIPGRSARIDGKEFFRQARSHLSLEQFSAFLANVKELNAHRQSREQTLKKAKEIFGAGNRDLFLSFQGLLSRNAH